MPRQGRLDFPEAIHYVFVSGRPGGSIFFDEGTARGHEGNLQEHTPRVQRFESLLGRACDESGALVHGYSWLPNAAIIVMQRFDVPLELIVGSVFGQYSRYLRSRGRVSRDERVYNGRYDNKVIAPMYLPYAVRRAHRSPVNAGLCDRPAEYPYSSARVYTGPLTSRWIDTTAVTAALRERGYAGPAGYRQFMDKADTEHVARLFACGSKWDRRVVGDRAFVSEAMRKAAHVPPAPTQVQLVEAVARLLGMQPTSIYERTHGSVIGRALVAWYATRSGAATLLEVGRWFSRSATTLRREIDKYKVLKPTLFHLSTQDLLSPRSVSTSRGPREYTDKFEASADVAD
jgi:putative transposase